MNPSAVELVSDWIRLNLPYQAEVKKVGLTADAIETVIVTERSATFAIILMDFHRRWRVGPCLFYVEELKGPGPVIEHKLPPLGSPDYFDVLAGLLKDAPRPL